MNTNQLIIYIKNELKARGIKNPELLEELTDHYMSQYELSKLNTHDHDLSIDQVKNNINQLTIKQFDMNNTNQYFNASLSLMVVVIFSLSFYHFSTASNSQSNIFKSNIWPVAQGQDVISSHFGMMLHPILNIQRMHKGIDFIGNIGEPVYATSDGVVSLSTSQKIGYGNHIVIDHVDTYQTKYCHLSELLVNVGDNVLKGEIIGLIGSSGSSTSPHLHYEVLQDGKNINPSNFL